MWDLCHDEEVLSLLAHSDPAILDGVTHALLVAVVVGSVEERVAQLKRLWAKKFMNSIAKSLLL